MARSRSSRTAARAASATIWRWASSARCSTSSPAGTSRCPGDDKELVYAPLGTPEADAYLDDMALGANFATVNHLLINALVLEAFQEVFPGVRGRARLFHQPQHRPEGDRRQPPGLGASQGSDARLSRPGTTR